MTDFNKRMRNAAISNLGEWTVVVNELESLLHTRAQEISDKRGDVSYDDAVMLIEHHARCRFALED
jgi:hypothetical protein